MSMSVTTETRPATEMRGCTTCTSGRMLQTFFEAMDTDRSGTISMDELQRMIMRQGYSAEVAKLLMYELDTNLDGEISWEELRTGLAECSFSLLGRK